MPEQHASGETGGSGALKCVVVTPEATVRDQSATFVAVPLFDGELGVGHNHSPMIGRMGFGELRIVDGGRTERIYVDGGFVEVLNNTVTVLTNRAVPADDLDAEVAREQLAAARAKKANTPELLSIRQRNEQQARAQLRVARRGAPNR